MPFHEEFSLKKIYQAYNLQRQLQVLPKHDMRCKELLIHVFKF